VTTEQYETIVRDGLLVAPGGMRAASIGVRDGRIAAIGDLDDARADLVVDARGKLVYPGLIDAHSHPVYGDDLAAYSQVMAYSGVTTIIPFVGAVPVWGSSAGDGLDAIDVFITDGEASSVLDFSMHTTFPAGVDAAREVDGMRERGVVSGKMFTCFPERGLYHDDRSIYELMSRLAARGCVAMVHPENDAIVALEQERLIGLGRTSIQDYPRSRPAIAEAEAVFRVCSIAETVGCPVYLVHLSSREAIEVVRWFRRRNRVPIYAETCTHYLALTEDDFAELGALIKISPPLRAREDREALWEALDDGTIDVVATDGSGQTRARKADVTGNVFDIPYGIPGSQSMVPLVFSEGVTGGRLKPSDIARIFAEQPARIFGL
jgi:dihydropyrimidinase